MWCIGRLTPEFVKRMYDILDLYEEEYDPKKPVVGVDEKLKELHQETRPALPMKPGSPEKFDYEYVRNGSANIFMAVEPKGKRRTTEVTNRRTKVDFALFMKRLVDEEYTEADVIRIVLDNLNTHFESSFYEAFDKEEARRILSKIEFHYTPKHASWLNVAEMELSAMEVGCTGRRMPDKPTLARELQAWTKRRNKQGKKINWRFTRKDADEKLSKHYVTE